ncbi:two-component response regulator-like APRR2 [Ziziphus jujuba]|uniref:Two-component response regulator-like APRR2 n=1 Tax=Ziziphus jujuba TaxID=326968 RepID=A0A6P4AHJ7_ZIZJJ|nr:two-component response regulator-like APRR2 [Ziziphus jujuba]XP_015896805.2 two-component response regulator-like APRR2 [Ziziphus jujuba]XP_015896806.2 two-component response regulator-like APRR2 [Ziziphus jujuba]XP_060674194.1 two-component response regulator-like APRR2 [Ziziphus jujuba]
MVCTANDLQGWKDFPKGLRVLVVDGDSNSAAEMRSKLEAMDYVVFTFCNVTEALSAFSSKPESFHVAIAEVNTSDVDESFKFLENAKDLPTIMTSNIHCLNTMMKCIALGAVEFLRKPLSDEKLRNIWQHVVHKAFNAGGGLLSKPDKHVKESIVSTLQLKLEKDGEPNDKISMENENVDEIQENDPEQSPGSDKYPAPSTPQLKQGTRLLDDGDCQDQTNCSTEKENGEQDSESKSVETTCCNTIVEGALSTGQPQMQENTTVKEEEDSADGSKNENDMLSHPHNDGSFNNISSGAEIPRKASGLNNLCGSKSNRKKIKVDWTPELHKKFVQAVEQLGVDQAIPSRILELMKVEGLTRHNVASHLQKYRMHKRHILPKEEDRRWPHHRDPMQRNYYPHKPIMAFPPYHSSHALAMPPIYPMWGQPGGHPASVQMWQTPPPNYNPWQPTESWHWKPYTGMHADAWGCPVMPPHGPYPSYPQTAAAGYPNAGVVDNIGLSMPQNSFELHPAEEVIDKVVKEAISKPWLPLPLGLKPPSTDGVLAELSKQGICRIPPQINGSNSF